MKLYVICDRISGLHVTNPIPALNVGVAMNGFLSFCKEQEEQGLKKEMYILYYIGDFADDGMLSNIQYTKVCAGADVEEALKEWIEVELAREEAE